MATNLADGYFPEIYNTLRFVFILLTTLNTIKSTEQEALKQNWAYILTTRLITENVPYVYECPPPHTN